MEIKTEELFVKGIRFFMEKDGKEIARAYIYIMENKLHTEPFGFMEDVYVDENARGGIYFSKLIDKVIEEAQQRGCYKLLATSRFERGGVHSLYKRMKFKKHGIEFRMDF